MNTVFLNGKSINHNIKDIRFSDGASTIVVKQPELTPDQLRPSSLVILVHPKTEADRVLHEVEMICEAVSNWSVVPDEITLRMPYFPYARADRVFEEGGVCGLQMFCNRLSKLPISSVVSDDIHNPDAEAFNVLYENGITLENREMVKCFRENVNMSFNDWDVLVAPDKGSIEKVKKVSDSTGIPMITMSKKRDPETGKILSLAVDGDHDLTGKKVLILDDITDGMGTHLWAAQLLKNLGAKETDLFVTHFIGANGALRKAKGLIDNILYANLVGNHVSETELMLFREKVVFS
ncbi:ribose-phosphate pyrophosphokinase [Pseudoalteromonas phage J2-1_QLiu-2017]|nr:ribose-phosphate pyrophosphokinase [Pseudoalteromonas phage J2-1_QLiu-2017]